MRNPTPIYRAESAVVHIDSCEPQLRAHAAGRVSLNAVSHGAYPGKKLAAADLPALSNAGFWVTRGPQDWGIPEHRNEGIEICWVESGEAALGVAGVVHALTPAVVSVTRPWEPHRLGDPHIAEGRLHWLILDVGVRRPNEAWRWPPWVVLTARDREELAGRLLDADSPVVPVAPDHPAAFAALAAAVLAAGEPGAESALAIAVNRILLGLLAALRARSASVAASVPVLHEEPNRRTVRLYWEDFSRRARATGPVRGVADMAAECGLGVTAFIAHTKAVVGATPADYVADKRLEAAAVRLRATAERVGEIAVGCGFTSSRYFATRFRAKYGMTPGEWRQSGA